MFGDGEQTRDFIYVKDIVAALVHAATAPAVHGSYNVGYGTSITVNELASHILRLSGSSSKITHLHERPGDVRHSRASIDKILGTGFQHVGALVDGLSETLDFFRPD